MPEFATQFTAHPRLISEPGSPVKQLYQPKYRDDGTWYLIEAGVHDLYAEIQSHAGSVDIHEILRRFAQGDVGALQRIQGAYGDFTQMPTTFAEALNTMLAAEQYFLGLPVETRAQFNHDYRQFIAAFDSPESLASLGLFDTPSAPTPDPNNLAVPDSASSAVTPSPSPQSPSSQSPSNSPSSPPPQSN